MFICENHKVVFVAVPKIATRIIYEVLEKYYDGKLYDEHYQIIPRCYKKFFSFTIIRNPYNRAYSDYWHACQKNKTRLIMKYWSFRKSNYA